MSDTQDAIHTQIDVEEREFGWVYAKALWGAAAKEGKTDEIADELNALLTQVVDKSPEVRRFFSTPSIGIHRREEVLTRLFKDRLSPLLFNFLVTVNRHDRLRYTRAILVCFHELANENAGRIAVTVKTAVPLDDDQLQAIKEMVAQKFSVDPEIVPEVDPSLLGGLYLRLGDRVFDRTVRYNLRNLKENVLARGKQ